MRGGAQVALIGAFFRAVAGASIDISADTSTSWGAPRAVGRCPLHKPFDISNYQGLGIGIELVPPGGGKFSVVEKEFPDAAKPILATSTGLIIRYTSPPGASGLSLWRIRVTSAADPTVRFAHLFSVPADGVTDETRYMPWKDFFGQIVERTSTQIKDCRDWEISDPDRDPRCTIQPGSLTHVSFLESEDTVAHRIILHGVNVTTDPIEEQNADQHHTEEQAALLWEREHAALNVKDFYFNGTHYVIGGNCSAPMGVCIVNDTSTTTTTVPPVTVIKTVTVLVPAAVSSAALIEVSRYLWVALITYLCGALCGH